uniref:Uncharacterized protein n=1 Tax=Arundo donax TaxID=35708 RepID=A0A0A9AJR4_ARUDO
MQTSLRTSGAPCINCAEEVHSLPLYTSVKTTMSAASRDTYIGLTPANLSKTKQDNQ